MVSETENYNNLKRFFDDEYHALTSYAESRIRNAADRDADDIVQDVALKMFTRANSISPINNIAGFVYNAIRNKVIDIMRTRKDTGEFPEDAGEEDEADEPRFDEAMGEALQQAIANLKPMYREVVEAIDLEGYSYKEVSESTGIPMGTLMSRRHRALSILHQELDQKKDF